MSTADQLELFPEPAKLGSLDAQLELFAPAPSTREQFEGRPLGAKELTSEDRLGEVARLVAQGYKPGEIGRALGITQVRASQMIREARARGLVDYLQEGRNKTTREMGERRLKLARKSFEALQKRMNYVERKSAKDIDARDVDDAFKALKITEHTAEQEVKSGAAIPPVQIALFSREALERADGVSARLRQVEVGEQPSLSEAKRF